MFSNEHFDEYCNNHVIRDQRSVDLRMKQNNQ